MMILSSLRKILLQGWRVKDITHIIALSWMVRVVVETVTTALVSLRLEL
jgi:hypothetical protein